MLDEIERLGEVLGKLAYTAKQNLDAKDDEINLLTAELADYTTDHHKQQFECEMLRTALRKYADHHYACRVRKIGEGFDLTCDCGSRELMWDGPDVICIQRNESQDGSKA